jgi:hypothetical protein
MHSAQAAALISKSALASAGILLASLGCAAPAQADHGRGHLSFFFGFNGAGYPYPAPVAAYPAPYYYYAAPRYYYYPPPTAYYAPPGAYTAPPATYYPPSAPVYSPPPSAYRPPPAAEHPPTPDRSSPAANNVRPPTAPPTQVASGGDCHEAQHMINIDGRSVSARGTLCRQPDGSYALSDPYKGSVASSR